MPMKQCVQVVGSVFSFRDLRGDLAIASRANRSALSPMGPRVDLWFTTLGFTEVQSSGVKIGATD